MARSDAIEKVATDPFGQGDFYFSESQGQLVSINQMPLPYARNVLVKLLKEYPDEFIGSEMHQALYQRLVPTRQQLRSLLSDGSAAVWSPAGANVEAIRHESMARDRLRKAGVDIGRKVRTHRSGDFIEGTCEPVQTNIRIRKRRAG